MILPLSIPSPDTNFLEVGPLRIYFYAICILVGIIAAVIVTGRRLTARGAERGVVIDFAVWAVMLGIIGARVYHVLTHPGDYFGEGTSIWEVFAIWNGGIAIFGALLGGAVGVIIASRLTGVRFWSFADALVPGMLLAQAFGRLGNWFNHELFGTPTTLPWGLEIEASNPAFPIGLPAGTLFHPTFLYEIVWNLLGLVVLLAIERKLRPRWGTFFAMYLVWYGVGRAVIESMRIDPSQSVLGLRVNVFTALVAVLIGLMLLLAQRANHPGVEVNVYRPGKVNPELRERAELAESGEVYRVAELLAPAAAAGTAAEPTETPAGEDADERAAADAAPAAKQD